MRRPLLLLALLAACYQPTRLIDPSPYAPLATALDAPDPSAKGPYEVKHFYYGTGGDKRRAEYRDSLTLRTTAVDGRPFLAGIDPKALKTRWKYWGFDAQRLPLNARVWRPDAPGKHPLVLVVHGNHSMTEFSDPGYAYLGEFLASRGYIVASIDENFLNGGIRGEIDARAWMLLEHLKAWQSFDSAAASPVRGQVDWSRIALIGHSRGGEAVAHAAVFNRLTHYPDDAKVRFKYGFDIGALVAIAPVDGVYRPADHLESLQDVNYLVLHGAHDADVSTFMGQRQYQRDRMTRADRRKAAIYIYRANHGQFNTVWGSSDVGPERGLYLRKSNLLSGDEQRRVGKTFIGAWLELTLRGESRYEPIFADARRAGPWLPQTVYLTRYERGGTRYLADFEEDVDVTTGSAPGVTIDATGFDTWRELGLFMRARQFQPYENHVARLAWKAKEGKPAPVYSLGLNGAEVGADAKASLVFEAGGEASRDSTATGPIDFRIEVEDAAGHRASVNSADVMPLPRELPIKLYKWAYWERRLRDGPLDVDQVMTRFAIPFSRFQAATREFDPAHLKTVRLVFDRAPVGRMLLDNIGIEAGRP